MRMLKLFLIFTFLTVPLFAASPFLVKEYSLNDQRYEKIKLEGVYWFVFDLQEWFIGAHENNPKLLESVRPVPIATIEVECKEFGGIGSTDPFFMEARKRAAKIGANALEYVSGVSYKNTEKIGSQTYKAYRFELNGKPLLPDDFDAIRNTPDLWGVQSESNKARSENRTQ